MSFDPSNVERRLDRATLQHPLLEHPFYRAWAEGSLTMGDLSFYATQYWRQVEAFPGYLEALSERLPRGGARSIVEANLADERDDDHAGLWLAFAQEVGASAERCRSTAPEAETDDCVGTFQDATRSASLPYALGMIYGYESQTPKVAETKVCGLRDRYGIEGEGLAYFHLHGELDVEHARELAQAISEVAEDEDALLEAEAGARAGAMAIWKLLDGVERTRNLA